MSVGAITWNAPSSLPLSPLHRRRWSGTPCNAALICRWPSEGISCVCVFRKQPGGWVAAAQLQGQQRQRPRRHHLCKPRCTGSQSQHSARRPTDMPAPGDNPRHSLQLMPLVSFPFTLHQLVFLKVRWWRAYRPPSRGWANSTAAWHASICAVALAPLCTCGFHLI